jgi:hypothetical protein
MTETFHSTAEVMAHYFPKYFPKYIEEKAQKGRGWIVIIPRPSVRR